MTTKTNRVKTGTYTNCPQHIIMCTTTTKIFFRKIGENINDNFSTFSKLDNIKMYNLQIFSRIDQKLIEVCSSVNIKS